MFSLGILLFLEKYLFYHNYYNILTRTKSDIVDHEQSFTQIYCVEPTVQAPLLYQNSEIEDFLSSSKPNFVNAGRIF